MESKKNLVLVGMMGSGKSTIGSILSKKLQFQFIDIDKKIEESEREKITTIFEKKGESYFRKLEEKITTNILASKNQVVSLGGGGFINKNIRNVRFIKISCFQKIYAKNTVKLQKFISYRRSCH